MNRLKLFFFVIAFCILLSSLSWGEEGTPSSITNSEQLEKLSQSINQAIQEEKAFLEGISNRNAELKRIQSLFTVELDSLNLLLSTYVNIANLSNIDLDNLEKVSSSLKTSLSRMTDRIKELEEKEAELATLISQTVEQRNINEQQLKDIRSRESTAPIAQSVIKSLGQLTDLLKKKEKELRRLHTSYQSLIEQGKAAISNGSTLLEKLEDHIVKRKREELFRRKQSFFGLISRENLSQELNQITSTVAALASKSFWTNQWKSVGRTTFVFLVVFLGLLAVIERMLKRLSGLLSRANFMIGVKTQRPYLFSSIQLVMSSIGLLGAVIFAQVYFRLNGLYESSSFVRFFVLVLKVWLFTRWFLDFIKNYEEALTFLKDELLRKSLVIYTHTVRWLAFLYLLIEELVGVGSLFLIYRFLMELVLLVAVFIFWKHYIKMLSFNSLSRKIKFVLYSSMFCSYFIFGGAILMEILGYSYFTSFWLAGWGSSAVVGLWAWVIAQNLLEWNRSLKTASVSVQRAYPEYGGSMEWLIMRMCWVIYAIFLVIAVLIAWGAKREVFIAIIKILYTPIPIGGINFRIISIGYALIVLFATKLLAQKIKKIMREVFFKHSGLEHGLQESVITIMGYLTWALGIIVALNIIGISLTSLAVVLGTLGIGLGFGLQQIFNNFVSGIILLIERPIQVGDVVEIGGLRGVVKKINVRATVVQTFDNTSFIIPNSEFISGKVVNWSFQDPTIRISIDVGVAYGSDVELVKGTLLEAASMQPRVLKNPPPDVLFVEFGDSALIFRLRFYAHVKDALMAETETRFLIYRLFNERGIEIPFPQRDIHIKSDEKIPLGFSRTSDVSDNGES
ncbi:MAG: mechanosensitive ion channel domain-containing protein [Thermodesulforhabdaceae bacterium]